MIRKILLGILVILGIAVTVFNPPLSFILAVGVWIYLVRMVQKQKNSESNDRMGPIIAESHLKRLIAFL